MQRIYHYVLSATILALFVCLQPLVGHNLLFANTVCVNPGGTHGCYASISAAVAAASPYDTVQVAHGTYNEDVVISRPVAIVGSNRANTIVNAAGQANGFNIDGLDNPGLANVTITGFTVENANFEGIVITNASLVNVYGNDVIHNDKALNTEDFTCPGLPFWETAEAFDCGEGIHLDAVDHSTIASNTVTRNSGGILISDETGVNHDNLISYNYVHDNPYDCGITIASHPPAPGYGDNPLGIAHNTIFANTSNSNGVSFGGAGIGVFDSVPGASNVGNVIVGNSADHNGIPGIALHSHTPSQVLSDTVIAGNTLTRNGPDDEDAQTPGPTGINVFGVSPATGTIVSQNTIRHEDVDVAVNTPTEVLVNLNNLLATGLNIGLDNLGTGSVNATENWWGCARGPNSPGCSNVSGANVLYIPWLLAPVSH